MSSGAESGRWIPGLGGVLCSLNHVARLMTASCRAQRCPFSLGCYLSTCPGRELDPFPHAVPNPSRGKLLEFCPSGSQILAIAKLLFKKKTFLADSAYNTIGTFFFFFLLPYLLLTPNTESLNWVKQFISIEAKPYCPASLDGGGLFQTQIVSKCSCFLPEHLHSCCWGT